MSTKSVKKIIFTESLDLKKTKQNNPHTGFLGNATYNTCAKFHGETVKPTLVGAPGNFCFLNKRHSFW